MEGVSKVTVTGWVKTADEQGFDALRLQQRSGRPPKLSAGQRAAILFTTAMMVKLRFSLSDQSHILAAFHSSVASTDPLGKEAWTIISLWKRGADCGTIIPGKGLSDVPSEEPYAW